jgi:BlaI family transcriptional regulator, penicillinase repressor
MLPENSSAAPGPRHSILDLAPLELDCLNVLWPLGEATVRDVQQALQPTRPRAYTTIMTILDRLAQKGVVQRQKAGRAWLYRANLSAAEARSHAIAQVVDGFFDGSPQALAAHLSMEGAAHGETPMPGETPAPNIPSTTRMAARLAAPAPQTTPSAAALLKKAGEQVSGPEAAPQAPATPALDASLL